MHSRHMIALLLAAAALSPLGGLTGAARAQVAELAATAQAAGGLIGDGRTDVSEALQQALDRDGIVLLPVGQYRITRPIQLREGMGIVGQGTLDVDFDSGEPDATNVALLCAGDNIRIEGIHIAKRFIDGSYGTGIQLQGGGYRGMRIRGVEISGYSARYGIHLAECEDFEISNCYIRDFMMNADADMIEDSPAGIRITRCRQGVISDNRIERIEVGPHGLVSISPRRPQYGPQRYQSDNMTVMQSRNITITGNTLITSGEAIDVLLSNECVITGNTIADVWFQGVKMLGVSFSTVSGNVIRGCHQGIGLFDHGSYNTDCNGNAITGNTILDSGAPGSFGEDGNTRLNVPSIPSAGIHVHGTADYNVIVGNVIMDTQTSKTMTHAILRNDKTNNVYANNVEDSSYERPVPGWEMPTFRDGRK